MSKASLIPKIWPAVLAILIGLGILAPGGVEVSQAALLKRHISALKAGTSQEEVMRLLGPPTSKNADGTLWFYSSHERFLHWPFATPASCYVEFSENGKFSDAGNEPVDD